MSSTHTGRPQTVQEIRHDKYLGKMIALCRRTKSDLAVRLYNDFENEFLNLESNDLNNCVCKIGPWHDG